MESERFEHLQRAVAAQTSRRGLAGLLGALTLAGAFALEGGNEAGAKNRRRRRKKARKKHGAAPFTPSPFSPLCTTVGGGCSIPRNCCDFPDPNGSVCIGDVYGNTPGLCKTSTCSSVAALKGGVACPQGPQCCRIYSSGCRTSCDCCESLACINGECTACKAIGGTCTSRSDCCGALFCSDGTCASCIAGDGAEGPCLRHSDCCGALLCDPEGYCMNCLNVGAPCADNSECCPGIICQSGVCQGL